MIVAPSCEWRSWTDCKAASMEDHATDFGSTMGDDALDHLQHESQPGILGRPGPMLNNIASITCGYFLFSLALVSRLLHNFSNFQRTIDQIQSEFWSSKALVFNSRKRRRDNQPNNKDQRWHFLQLIKSFALFHRHIHSPWYIKPKAIS